MKCLSVYMILEEKILMIAAMHGGITEGHLPHGKKIKIVEPIANFFKRITQKFSV